MLYTRDNHSVTPKQGLAPGSHKPGSGPVIKYSETGTRVYIVINLYMYKIIYISNFVMFSSGRLSEPGTRLQMTTSLDTSAVHCTVYMVDVLVNMF